MRWNGGFPRRYPLDIRQKYVWLALVETTSTPEIQNRIRYVRCFRSLGPFDPFEIRYAPVIPPFGAPATQRGGRRQTRCAIYSKVCENQLDLLSAITRRIATRRTFPDSFGALGNS